MQARAEDGRPLGQLMGDAIRKSVDTLMLIGGFIILFSVIIRILDIAGVTGLLGQFFEPLLQWSGLSPDLAPALISGLFEIDPAASLRRRQWRAMRDKLLPAA